MYALPMRLTIHDLCLAVARLNGTYTQISQHTKDPLFQIYYFAALTILCVN